MMKKKIIALLVIVLMLSPFLGGLLSASSIWKTSASNDETEEIIKNDNLVLTQTVQESQEGPYIQLNYQKRKAQEDENLRLHFLVKEDNGKNIEIDEADGFGKTEDGWYSEQRVSETGSLKIPVTAGTKYQLYTRFVSEIPVKESEDNPEGTTENVEKNVGEVIETPLLNDKEQEAKELIFVPAKQELDLTNLKNPNDTETLVQIKGFKVSYTSTLKDNGNKADWQLKFDKNLVEGLNYRIRYSVYDNQNPKNANENGAEPKFQEMNIKDNNNRERKYRQERYVDDKTKTASLKNSFTTSFSTDGKAINLIIGLVDEDDNFVALFNDNNVVAVDSTAVEKEEEKADNANSIARTLGQNVSTQATTSPDGLPYAQTVYDDEPSARLTTLRAAGLFHIFAKKIELNQHLNGNFASPIANISTNTGAGSANELFYAGTLGNGFNGINKSPDYAPAKFVLGSGIRYEKKGNEIYLNDRKVDFQGNVIFEHESTTPYIDFTKEFNYLENLNKDIATWSPDIIINRDFFKDSQNQINSKTIDLREEPYKDLESVVIKIDPSAHDVERQLTIIGLEPDHSGKVRNIYFNVEVPTKVSNFNYNLEIKLKDSAGNDIQIGEHSTFTKSPILYNFYSAASDSLYKEQVNISKIIQGAVLAPGAKGCASITVEGNLIFAEWKGGTETHKWDYKPKGSVTIIKQDPIEGEFLGGAEFDLYVIEYKTEGNNLVPTHVKVNPDNNPYVTDSKGRLTVSGLSQGYQYYFIETKPPLDKDNNPYPAYTDPIYFTIIPGTTTTTTYHPVYNVKAQEEFEFGAKKLLKDTVDKDTSFLFEIQKIVAGNVTDTKAYGKVTYTKTDSVNTEKVVKFYRTTADRDNDNNRIGNDEWMNVLEDGENYQLIETTTNGYNVKYSGYGGEGNNLFTANFTEGKAVHINFLVTNYEDEFTVKGQKEVSEIVKENKTFKFEIKEKNSPNILAYGKAEVKKDSKIADIEFFKDAAYTISISGNDWFGIVDPDKTYVISETDSQEYQASYKVNGITTDEIHFIAGAVNNITLYVKNSKKEEKPKIDLKGTKKLVDETLQEKETKTFHFELRHQSGEKPATGDKLVANGEAVTSNGDSADIIFTDTNSTAITTAEQWTNLLKPGKYYIVETDSDGYSVTYTISGMDSGPEKNSFTIPAILEKSITIQFEAVNTKDKSYKFEAQKKVTGNVPLPKEGKTFKFEIQDKSEKAVALGSANILVKNKPVNIVFTDKAENSITDWTKILNDGEKYTLVETTTEYHVSYLDESGSNKENTFTVEYGDNATMYFLVQNDLDVGDLPSTGGSGIVKFMQLSLIVILIGVGIGGYYWYRNKKVN